MYIFLNGIRLWTCIFTSSNLTYRYTPKQAGILLQLERVREKFNNFKTREENVDNTCGVVVYHRCRHRRRRRDMIDCE